MTCRVFRGDWDVLGGFMVVQKSSASLPDLYPCWVMGVESKALAIALPLASLPPSSSSCASDGGFDLQTNWGGGI